MAKRVLAVKFVRILWYDASDGPLGWSSLTEPEIQAWMEKPALVLSYGYLVKKTRHYYILAADLCDDLVISRLTKIPVDCVKNMKVIKVPPLRVKGGR